MAQITKQIIHQKFSNNEELQNLFVLVREHQIKDGYCKQLGLYRKIEKLAREQNAEKEIAHIMSVFARYYLDHKQYKKALQCIFEALPIAKKHEMNSRISNLYNWLAGIHLFSGDYSTALDYFQAEVEHNIKSGIEQHCFIAYNLMGNIYNDIDDHETASKFFTKAKDLIIKYPDFLDIVHSEVYLNTSLIVLKSGLEQYEEAKQLCFQSIELAKQSNDKRLLPNIYSALSLICYDTGEHQKGIEYANEAKKYLTKTDFENSFSVYRVFALNHYKLGNKQEAAKAFKECFKYFDKIPTFALLKIETLHKAAELFEATNAKRDLQMVQKILRETELTYHTLQARLALRAEQLISFTNRLAPAEIKQPNGKLSFHAIGLGKITLTAQEIYACQTQQATAGKNVSLMYVVNRQDYYRIPSALNSIFAMINDDNFIWINRNTFVNKKHITDWELIARRGIVNMYDKTFDVSRRKRKELLNNTTQEL